MAQWEEDIRITEEEKFQRVWERVMEGKPNPIACGRGKESKNTMPCYGDISAKDFLASAITACHVALAEYVKLNKQVPKQCKSVVEEMILAVKTEKTQLETAYFLITGEECHAPTTFAQLAPMSWENRIRELFYHGQLWQDKYQKQAFLVEDSCLTSLYLQLEREKRQEVSGLKALMETLFGMK